MASLIGKPGFIKLGQLLLPLGTIWKGCQLIIHKVALSYSWLPPKTPADRNGDKVNALFVSTVLRCCANNAFSKLETRVGRKFLTDKMGVFRQLLRRPALPFLIVVSCLLVASPLWRTNQVLDKLFNLSLSRMIRLASWSWNHSKQKNSCRDFSIWESNAANFAIWRNQFWVAWRSFWAE